MKGRGLVILKSPEDLKLRRNPKRNNRVIQRYLEEPLLINGKKHDLRLYVLIASVEPFIIFLNEEGLARFCTEDYQAFAKEVDAHDAHLTNYAINKDSPNYVYNEKISEENQGTKQTLASYWKSVAREGHNVSDVF